MQDNQEQKERKRSLRNVANNNTVDNFINPNNENKQNSGNNSQIQVYVRDSQDNQVDANNKENQNTIIQQDNNLNKPNNQDNQNNLNQQLNIESPPPISNEPILDPQNMAQIPQGINNNNPNTNGMNQFQQIPVQNYPILANQLVYPQNGIIVIQQVPVGSPLIINRYTSTDLTCPYCRKIVKSVPDAYWTCESCCMCMKYYVLYYFTACIGFFIHFIINTCNGEDLCFCEATHRCPNCKNIIAKRIILC